MVFEDNENLSEFASNQEDGFTDEALAEQGFEDMSPKILRRINSDKHTYNVYSDEQSFESIVVESIINGINDGTIKSPYKIINTHSRIPDIIVAEDLELVPQEELDAQQPDEQTENEQLAPAEKPEAETSETEIPEAETPAEQAEEPAQEETGEIDSSQTVDEKDEE